MEGIIQGPIIDIPQCGFGEYCYDRLKLLRSRKLLVDLNTQNTFTADTILKRSINLSRWITKTLGSSITSDVSGLDRTVMICSDNSINYIIVSYAANFSATPIAYINHLYGLNEFQHALRLTNPSILFCSKSIAKKFMFTIINKKLAPRLETFVIIDECEEALKIPMRTCLTINDIVKVDLTIEGIVTFRVEPVHDPVRHISVIMMSSGTTGLFKACKLTHGNMVTTLHQRSMLFAMSRILPDLETALFVAPMSHILGLFVGVLTPVLGSKVVLPESPFNWRSVLKCIQDHKVTTVIIPPVLVARLAKDPQVLEYDLSSLSSMRVGSSTLNESATNTVFKRVKTIRSFSNVYGLTETTGAVFGARRDQPRMSVGQPHFNMEAKIVDENNRVLGANQVGEVCIRGPTVFGGYLNDDKATRAVFDDDGFFHTGDLGYYNDRHFFFITGRIKELIKYKGFQVAPLELENILMTHPSVQDCAVIGVPDPDAGELPKAYVVIDEHQRKLTTPSDLQQFVNAQVAPFKQLRGGVQFIDEIPRNHARKIMRRRLEQLNVRSKI